jgi:hypothetical protein
MGHLGVTCLGYWTQQAFTGLIWISAENQLVMISLFLGLLTAFIPAIQVYRSDLARILANA